VLALSDNTLYAGGSFTNAGGVSANSVAQWNGSSWSALGSGVGGVDAIGVPYLASVYALAVSGSTLYAGGDFNITGGVSVNCIASWDGNAWSVLGSGVSFGLYNYGDVYALAADTAGHLFVGGYFYFAGTNVSPCIAQANLSPNVNPGLIGNPVYSPLTGFSCTFSEGTVGQAYHIQTSPSLAAGTWADLTNFTYSVPIVIIDSSSQATPMKFYRAASP
jgi:hypothetical protein